MKSGFQKNAQAPDRFDHLSVKHLWPHQSARCVAISRLCSLQLDRWPLAVAQSQGTESASISTAHRASSDSGFVQMGRGTCVYCSEVATKLPTILMRLPTFVPDASLSSYQRMFYCRCNVRLCFDLGMFGR
jgi:hypothetical protein